MREGGACPDAWGGYGRSGRRIIVGVEAVDFPEEDFVGYDFDLRGGAGQVFGLTFGRSGEDEVAVEHGSVDVVGVYFSGVEVRVVDRERCRMASVPVSAVLCKCVDAGDGPDSDGSIKAGGHDPLAVRVELGCEDVLAVAFAREDSNTGLIFVRRVQIPESNSVVG